LVLSVTSAPLARSATIVIWPRIRASGWEGRGVPVHCTSAGRVLLMDATPDELAVRFPDGLAHDTGQRTKVRTLADLYEQIKQARAAGYAVVDEEFEEGLVGTSAPIRDFRGRIVAAINISAPKARLGDRLDEAGQVTVDAARTVSRQLGWEPRTVGGLPIS
jgi:IclR family KDG regulon transcriptional repressor